ncbi:MAG TPA: hypothetical protein DDW52_05540 [Planctomycetaceae bacterium]|nr:hypothetical protein [Planctomycetaceae bacterium]
MRLSKKRFGLWALFALIALVAFPASWCGNRMRNYTREQEVLAGLRAVHENVYGRSTYFGPAWIPATYRPKWLNRVFAIDVSGRMYNPKNSQRYNKPFDFDDKDLESIIDELQEIENLQELQLGYSNITEASIDSFKRLPKLSFVNAQGTQIKSNKVISRDAEPDIKIHVALPKTASLGIGYGSD